MKVRIYHAGVDLEKIDPNHLENMRLDAILRRKKILRNQTHRYSFFSARVLWISKRERGRTMTLRFFLDAPACTYSKGNGEN